MHFHAHLEHRLTDRDDRVEICLGAERVMDINNRLTQSAIEKNQKRLAPYTLVAQGIKGRAVLPDSLFLVMTAPKFMKWSGSFQKESLEEIC